MRTIAVHVQSENDPTEFSLAQVDLDVGTRSRTTLRVDPVTVTGRQRGPVLAHRRQRRQRDGAGAARWAWTPRTSSRSRSSRRPSCCRPAGARSCAPTSAAAGRGSVSPSRGCCRSASAPDSPPAMATFVQRPRIGRWLISLLGLVTVAGIFALVLSTVADRLVDESAVDDDAARRGADPARRRRRRGRSR